MDITRRAFTSGIMGTASAAALAACSDNGGTASPSAGTVDYWTDVLGTTPAGKAESAWFRQFEKANPGVKINEHRIASANFDSQFKTAVSGGQGADVLGLNIQFFRDYVRLGLLDDVTSTIDPIRSSYYPWTWDQLHTIAVKDGTFGLPQNLTTCGIYYNKKVFSDNNLKIPSTWDDIRAMIPILKPNGISPFVYAGAEPWWNPMWFNLFFYQETGNDGIAVNDQMMRGKVSFNSAPYIKAISDVVSLNTDNVLISGNQGMTTDTANAAFVQGKAAMFYSGSWLMSSLPNDFDYGVFPTPTLNPNLKSQPPGSVSDIYSVVSSSKNKSLAQKLLSSFATTDFLKSVLSVQGAGVPLQPALQGTNQATAMREFEKIGPSTIVWLDALWEPEIITAVQQGVQAAIVGTKTPQQVCTDIANQYTQLRSQGKTFFS